MSSDIQSVREPVHVPQAPPELENWWPDGIRIWCQPPRWLLMRVVNNKLIEDWNEKMEKVRRRHGDK